MLYLCTVVRAITVVLSLSACSKVLMVREDRGVVVVDIEGLR